MRIFPYERFTSKSALKPRVVLLLNLNVDPPHVRAPWKAEKRCFFAEIYVFPALQGRGLGRKMLALLEAQLKGAGHLAHRAARVCPDYGGPGSLPQAGVCADRNQHGEVD